MGVDTAGGGGCRSTVLTVVDCRIVSAGSPASFNSLEVFVTAVDPREAATTSYPETPPSFDLATAELPRPSVRDIVGAYVALMKPRIIELLLITTIPTMVLAERGWPSLSLMLLTLVGGTLAAGGANAINMYVDRDIDAVMKRTRNRPLVTGLIQPLHGLMFAIGLEIDHAGPAVALRVRTGDETGTAVPNLAEEVTVQPHPQLTGAATVPAV